MKRLSRKLSWIILAVVLVIAWFVANQFLPIATGFAAKNMCSCVFVAGRQPQEIQTEDLHFSLVQFTKSRVDFENKVVRSSLFGLFAQKAAFRPGFGCSLVFEKGIPQRKENPQLDCLMDPEPMGTLPDSSVLAETDYSYKHNYAVDPERLNSVIASVIDEGSSEGIHLTRSIVVLHEGKRVAEDYAPGFDASTLQLGWSMSKSVTSAVTGLLVREGRLSLDMPAPIPEWQDDARAKITIRNLLQQTAGLEWEELYGTATDVTHMLYMEPSKSAYAISRPLAFAPGTHWVYSSGTTNILSHILMRQFPDADAFVCHVKKHLFDPVGISSMVMETDASDEVVGSSYMYATARDWARFGQLYLQDGIWNGNRILPEGWVSFTATPAPGSEGTYGAQFFLNASGKFPDIPKSMFYADGFQGQRVYILPTHDLVVVRLALTSDFDENGFLRDILDCFSRVNQE